jgi:chromosome segregation ATPase
MADFFGFLKSFGKGKFGQVGESITQKIVSWDPETATQAEIETMIEELDKITREAGKAKTEYEREKAEADAAQKNHDRYMAAADLINSQLEGAKGAGDEAKVKELSASLEKLLGDLETMNPEVQREAREAQEAYSYYEEVKALAETSAEKLKTARSQLDRARRDMRTAEIEKERAQGRAEKSEHLAGLKTDASNLGVALAAMNKQAEQARADAESSDMKAKLLSPETQDKDSNIEDALKAVSGETKPAQGDFADRLAALKRK